MTKTEKKAGHTPLPWKAFGGELTFGKEMYAIAEFYNEAKGGNAEANAEFAARACNSYIELLLAAKLALKTIEMFDTGKEADDDDLVIVKQLKDAIAKAEGGTK